MTRLIRATGSVPDRRGGEESPQKCEHDRSPLPEGEGQGEGENAAREVDSVHRMFMAKCHPRTRERVKGNTAFPFTIPAAPQRNRCFALHSPPAPLPAVGLTRVTRPIPGARPSGQRAALFKIVPDDFVLSRQTSVRHPWRPDLVIGSSSHRFQRGLNPISANLRVEPSEECDASVPR